MLQLAINPFEFIEKVQGPYTLIAFIVAALAWIAWSRIHAKITAIDKAPAEKRADLARQLLEDNSVDFGKIDPNSLTREQKYKLALAQLRHKHERHSKIVIIGSVVITLAAIMLFVLAILNHTRAVASGSSHSSANQKATTSSQSPKPVSPPDLTKHWLDRAWKEAGTVPIDGSGDQWGRLESYATVLSAASQMRRPELIRPYVEQGTLATAVRETMPLSLFKQLRIIDRTLLRAQLQKESAELWRIAANAPAFRLDGSDYAQVHRYVQVAQLIRADEVASARQIVDKQRATIVSTDDFRNWIAVNSFFLESLWLQGNNIEAGIELENILLNIDLITSAHAKSWLERNPLKADILASLEADGAKGAIALYKSISEGPQAIDDEKQRHAIAACEQLMEACITAHRWEACVGVAAMSLGYGGTESEFGLETVTQSYAESLVADGLLDQGMEHLSRLRTVGPVNVYAVERLAIQCRFKEAADLATTIDENADNAELKILSKMARLVVLGCEDPGKRLAAKTELDKIWRTLDAGAIETRTSSGLSPHELRIQLINSYAALGFPDGEWGRVYLSGGRIYDKGIIAAGRCFARESDMKRFEDWLVPQNAMFKVLAYCGVAHEHAMTHRKASAN